MSEKTAFLGFPKESLQFFRSLAANNNRVWFEAHKQDYLDYVQTPAVAFTATLGARLQTLSNGIQFDLRTNGSGSVMRIYRDIRFSKDKTPYKTNLGIMFWQGKHKKMECPGFYFHLDANGAAMYDGLYVFPEAVLPVYRDAVIDEHLGASLETAIASVKGAGDYEVGGEQTARVPRGYDPAHPRGNLLRHKGLHARSPLIDATILASPQLIEVCFEHCRAMMPLHNWLVEIDSNTKG
ncbi:MAG: DUF2461 domain-containing protein [Acidobacteriales bacterium]|nr:DUF2461 domain-containing protein [Terriglobales bacterium]